MTKFIIGYELAGHIEVDAETSAEALEKVETTDINKLLENIRNFNVGKYYIEKIDD